MRRNGHQDGGLQTQDRQRIAIRVNLFTQGIQIKQGCVVTIVHYDTAFFLDIAAERPLLSDSDSRTPSPASLQQGGHAPEYVSGKQHGGQQPNLIMPQTQRGICTLRPQQNNPCQRKDHKGHRNHCRNPALASQPPAPHKAAIPAPMHSDMDRPSRRKHESDQGMSHRPGVPHGMTVAMPGPMQPHSSCDCQDKCGHQQPVNHENPLHHSVFVLFNPAKFAHPQATER